MYWTVLYGTVLYRNGDFLLPLPGPATPNIAKYIPALFVKIASRNLAFSSNHSGISNFAQVFVCVIFVAKINGFDVAALGKTGGFGN